MTKFTTSQMLLVGRLRIDGATNAYLTEKYTLSDEEIEQCWEYCRERLSKYFSEYDGSDYRLYSDDEVFARTGDCIEVLLDWYERELVKEKIEASHQVKN